MGAVACPSCGQECWDNRNRKNTDAEWVTSPDFVCKDKANCGWKGDWNAQTGQMVTREKTSGKPRGGPRPPANPAPLARPSAGPPLRQATPYRLYAALYRRCFDTVMEVWPKTTPADALAAAVATLFIGAKDCAEMRGDKPAAAPAAAPPVRTPPPPTKRSDFAEVPEALEEDGDDLAF